MTQILRKFLLVLLLVLPSTLMLAGNGVTFVNAESEDEIMEDTIEGEDDGDATVESEEETINTAAEPSDTEKEEEEEEAPIKASPDADSHILFTQPKGSDFPAGHMVRFLVGFTNKGSQDFIIDSMDASFRYPQDYSFHIQNFTAARYDRVVEPKRQATFEYAFTPSETFHARPFGLTINLNYHDADGKIFQDAVFNETINIVEPDEGLDGETFFLYVFLAAVVVLLLVGAQQLLANVSKKRLSKPRSAPIEMGTQNKGDVDYDWLPKETLDSMNKSPRRSPRQSPGRRRVKRSSASTED